MDRSCAKCSCQLYEEKSQTAWDSAVEFAAKICLKMGYTRRKTGEFVVGNMVKLWIRWVSDPTNIRCSQLGLKIANNDLASNIEVNGGVVPNWYTTDTTWRHHQLKWSKESEQHTFLEDVRSI